MRKGNHLFLDDAIYVNPSGLGNFIQVTPALQCVADITGKKVRVQKMHDYIHQCFLDAPFLEWLDEAEGLIPISYDEWDWKAQIPDYEFGFRQIVGQDYDDSYHTYVDTPILPLLAKSPYIVLMNGGNASNPRYLGEKQMTPNMLIDFFDSAVVHDISVCFCGSSVDFNNTLAIYPDLTDRVIPVLDNMRLILSHLKSSSLVVSNDTGLYHASCAMKKNVIVSDRVPTRRNHLPSICIQTPNPNARIVSEREWSIALEKAMKSIKK